MRLEILVIAFTLFVCCLVAFLNPVLCMELDDGNFTQGEVFMPADGQFDFETFTLNSSRKNFTVYHIESGHVSLADDTGDRVINVIQFDKMMNFKKDSKKSFLNGELQKTNWMVDGVCIHEIEFMNGEKLYSACVKDVSTNTMVYVATPSDKETADMINSLDFTD
ncbi:hypothetical protein [Methanobrevibacter sp.]|uniref:hypothetical protein n=1 Tax=Methanobrevibacter sp. TaxID=66852 RepID=UPI00386F1BE4